MEKKTVYINKFKIGESYKKDLFRMAAEDKRKEHDFIRVQLERLIDNWRESKVLKTT